MKHSLLIVATILALSARANDTAETKKPMKVPRAATSISKVHKLKMIHVADLQNMMDTQKDNLVIFDANGETTRKKEGMIPGAKPLTSANDYDLAVLPTNKTTNLVFYCANTMCTASHDAANKAIKAGYTNVRVLAEGIKGWKDAKKPTETFTN